MIGTLFISDLGEAYVKKTSVLVSVPVLKSYLSETIIH